MNKLTTSLLRLGAVLLLFIGFAGTASAQNFAAPLGQPYAGDGTCIDPANPCTLAGASEDATDGAGSTEIYIRLANSGATTSFQEDLVGTARLDANVTFDTYTYDPIGVPNVVTGVAGISTVAGDVIVGNTNTVTIVGNLELRLEGQPGRLELRNDSEILGPGFVVFSANTGSHTIQLGDPTLGCPGASPKVAFIENMRINKIGGVVTVFDQCQLDDESDVFITNRLEVLNGVLDMDDNNLHFVGPTDNGATGGVEIGGGALIEGDGTSFISVDPAALGGPTNDLAGCYEIEGDGNLNMAFDKNTDAGVCVELNEIGTGGTSYNRAGSLFVTDAVQHNGTFRNENGARTEFWELGTITSNLEVDGPGSETDPTGTIFTNGTCETGGAGNVGNESGVYFFSAVTVEGDLILDDSDDPATVGCVEGVWFMGDDEPGVPGAAAAKAAAGDDPNPFSTIEGDFTADEATGVYLDAFDFFHNVAFQGDFAFDESPWFVLDSPGDAYPTGDLCADYTVFSDGNKVLFTGGDDQNLLFNTLLDIQSVQVNKESSNDDVEIDEASAAFLIDTTLEIIRGNFVTNGLLDANAGTTRGEGNTVVVNRDADGDGILDRGDADRAYLSDAIEHTPRKVKYTGSSPHFTGDEVPGPSSGSVGGPEVTLDELEIFQSDPSTVITVSKDFTLASRVTLTSGILDVGSSKLKIGNGLQAEIGDGRVAGPEQIGSRGELIFPTEHVAGFNPGTDGIDLLYFGTMDRTAGLLFPPAETDVAGRKVDEDVIRDVTIDPICADDIVVSLRSDDLRSRINRDLIIGGDGPGQDLAGGSDVGALDIAGQILEISASGENSVVEVHNDADLCDSTGDDGSANCDQGEAVARTVELANEVSIAMAEYRLTRSDEAKAKLDVSIAALKAEQAAASKSAAHAGLLKFIGSSDTDVWIETSQGRLRFDFPAIEVDRPSTSTTSAHVTFDAEGVLSTTAPGLPANNPDILGTPHFTLVDAAVGDDDLTTPDASGVALLDGLDVLDVGGQYEQYDGEFVMAGVSSIGPAPTNEYSQTVRVGFSRQPGDMIIDDGEFFATGGIVENFGNYIQGANLAADAGDALFSLSPLGDHVVVGDFTVGPDSDPAERPNQVIDDRNRYFLGGECGVLPDMGGLFLNGNYHFDGTGDNFDDDAYPADEQGLMGNVFFTGAIVQNVWHRQDEDAFFCDVVMASRSDDNDGILLLSDGWQNAHGTLTLEHGIIDTDEEQWDWIILNPGFETDLAGRNNSARGTGVVDLGSRDSYINGEVDRVVETGNATGGVITGGYLFPVGTEGEPRSDGSSGNRDVDFFRPLILQFPDDLGRSSVSRVDYRQDLTSDMLEFPDEGLVVDAVGGGTLTLDAVGDQFWQLEFDRIPSFDPNVRVEADDMPNIFDIKSLRLVQWDCDGTNPRLAGLYDLDVGPVDDASAVLNDFINSVPNLTQEGVDVNDCNIIGIASSFLINPINLPPLPSGIARVQIIHNSPDAGLVDVYIDDTRYMDDFAFQTATPFVPVPGGTHKVDIVAGDAADNSSPVWTGNLTVANQTNYVVVAHGYVNDLSIVVREGVRLEATTEDTEFFMIHGAPDLGEVDIRLLDPVTNNDVVGLLANNISFDDVGTYLNLAPAGYNVQVTNADNSIEYEVFRFELQSYGGETFVLNLSGQGKSNSEGFTMLGVETSGATFKPDVITAGEEEVELPTEFALKGNYPNPFNPATTIQIDLPETAEVTVEIIDMLGRSVMAIPAKQLEAGAARSIEVNGASLASGTYLYRVIAKTATDTMVKTGRMMLIK